MNSYKLAIFDIDGTLTNSQKELTPRTKEAVIALQQQGVKVALASGRPTYGITPLAHELELAKYGGYILAYNGGVIIDCATKEALFSQLLPAELLEPLYHASKEYGCTILSYSGEEILAERIDCQYVQHEAMLNKMPLRRIDSFLDSFRNPLPKCLAVGEPSRAKELEQALLDRYSEVMSIYRSEPFFVELVPLGIDKALSLGRLAEHIGITPEEMIAFGDGFNDLSMIEYAGCGVAMANAQEVVRERANAHTLSNDHDGVAHYIEEMLKNRR